MAPPRRGRLAFDVVLSDGHAEGRDRVREVLLVADPERIARARVTRDPGLTVLRWDDPPGWAGRRRQASGARTPMVSSRLAQMRVSAVATTVATLGCRTWS